MGLGRLLAFPNFKGDEAPEIARRLHLAIAAPTILLLCFLTAPFEVWDEPAHFLRVVAVSDGDWLPSVSPATAPKKAAGAYEDSTVVSLAGRSQEIAGYAGHHYSLAEIRQKASERESGTKVFSAHSNTAIYPPYLYGCSAGAVFLAKRLGFPPLWWLYLARLANALLGLFIVQWALRKSGDAALVLFLSSLLPITLFQMASVSADALLLPLFFGFAVLLLQQMRSDNPQRRETAALAATTIFLCAGKIAYMPLALLPPWVARWADGSWSRRSLQLIAASTISVVLWLGWAVAVHRDVFSIRPNVVVDPNEQLRFVLAHPLASATIFARSIVTLFPQLVVGAVGARLGWGDLKMPLGLILLLPFGLLAASIPAVRPQQRSAAVTALTCAVSLASFCAIFLLIYLQYNAVGASFVDGLQGRYFTPLGILLLSLTPRLRVDLRYMCWIWGSAALVATASAVITLWTVLQRYW